MKRTFCYLAAFVLIGVGGCAPAYHCYTCGKVPCRYSPLPPLPYAMYEEAGCCDSIGQQYLSSSVTLAAMDKLAATSKTASSARNPATYSAMTFISDRLQPQKSTGASKTGD